MTQSLNHSVTETLNDAILLQSAIQRLIPHRYPFLLVDRVTEFAPGQRIVGIKNFSLNDEMSQGYSPGAPAVPLSVVLEAVTQLGAILVLARPEMVGKVAVVLQIPSARSLEPIQPGDFLRLEARVLKLKENFGELHGSAYCEGKCVGEGRMRFGIANARDLLPGKPADS